MSIAAYIKVIGRGKDGARPLDATQSEDLLGQILDGGVSDLEIGAFCLAMRIKGETAAELDGFVKATLARSLPLPRATAAATSTGVVILPSYNGARKLPNLTPLLAWSLSRRGVKVLVHGPLQDPTRVTSAQLFQAASLPVVTSDAELAAAWLADRPAFLPIETLCPALARLLAVRWTIGLRNPGHTVAKLLDPFAQATGPGPRTVRVVNHTHPEYAYSLSEYLQRTGARALLMRGTEGEPVADARRQPRFEVFVQGARQAALSQAPNDGVLTALPALPENCTAEATVPYMQAVMAGDAPLPDAIQTQVDCLIQTLHCDI